MPEAIRDRRPTEADLCDGFVLLWEDDKWIPMQAKYIMDGNIWKPIDQTPPPEPEKPKRWKGEVYDRGELKPAIEILPSDPPDLDALLREIDTPVTETVKGKSVEQSLLDGYRDWTKRIKAARHGEGGDA